MDSAHSFPNSQLEMNHQRENKNQVQSLLSSTFLVFYIFFFFTHLLSITLSPPLFFSPVTPPSMLCSIFTHYIPLFFSITISPCQQCQLSPCRAEKIEAQIEQSISVRIHQCQTTPSCTVCIKHAHIHRYF